MDPRSYRKLVVLNAVMLLTYTIAEIFVWASVSRISYITSVFWSPIAIYVAFHLPSGSGGSSFAGNASFLDFILILGINLGLARAPSRRYPLFSVLSFGYFAWANDVVYFNLFNMLSEFQSNVSWNHLFIAVGNATTIIPNLTLLVALATTVANIVYVQLNKSKTDEVQTKKLEES